MSKYSDKARRVQLDIKQALINEWDPIGIGDIPEAQDEYDSYVATIYKFYLQNKTKSEIFDYLWWIETEHMGLVGDRQRTEKFAEKLLLIFFNNYQ